jgi:hypothetical protein
MTLAGFVAKNALRNKCRALPTILSVGFSILLLTIMMSLWRSFYIDQLSSPSTIRLFTRSPHVFFTYAMPTDYRQKIKAIPGVLAIAPLNLFNAFTRTTRLKTRFLRAVPIRTSS